MRVQSPSLVTACKGRVWEDPSVYGINKRSSHVELNGFTVIDDAVKYVGQIGRELAAKPQNCGKQSLNGKWNFKLFPSPDDVPPDFMNGSIADDWSLVKVPGNWETQGFGRPVYTNFKYPFDVNPPYVPSDNPTGCYITSFTVQADVLAACHLSLVFDGVDSACGVWLNGTFVGYSQDSRLPAEFSICGLCNPGSNTLAVQVMKWSDGSYLEDQDMWCLSGIFRDVYILQRAKKVHITDYHLQTPLQLPSSGPPSASVKAEVHVSAEDASTIEDTVIKVHIFGEVTLGTEPSSQELIASVEAPAEAVWSGNDTTGQPDAQAARCGGRAVLHILPDTLQGKVSLWSAEQPTVYCVVVEVCTDAGASVCHVEASQLAFRHSSIVNGKLVHNGAAIMLRGVNRHEHDEYNGKVVSEESMVTDILLMKQANFNAVRMSHYPNTQRFYQLCTAFGLYAIDEANLETHGFDATLCKNYLNPANCQLWSACMMDRGVRMFEQNKNHGCIVAWSLGNESGYGAVHAAMSAFIRHRDPSRVLHYEGGGSCTPATDLICPMYARRQQIETMAKQNADRPIVLCEYAHAMGNSGGGLADYWRLFESNDRCQGGFIWDWVDQGLMMKEGMPGYAGQEYWAFGGGFGDPCHDAQFCINGLMFPNRQPHPSLHEVKHVQAPIHLSIDAGSEGIGSPQVAAGTSELGFTVCVCNRYDFKDLQHVLFQWRLTVGGVPVQLSLGHGKQCMVPQEYGAPAVPVVANFAAASACLALNSAQIDSKVVEEQAWQALKNDVTNALKPEETASIQIAVTAEQLQVLASLMGPEGDTFLEVRAVTRETTFWAPQGHTVVCTQCDVSSQVMKAAQLSQVGAAALGSSRVQEPASATKMQVQSSDAAHTVILVSDGSVQWEVTVDNSTGMLRSWKRGAFDVLQSPAELCLVRAPTDNDLGGSYGTSHAARWLDIGLDRELVPSSCTVSVQQSTDSSVTIQVECEMTATGRTVLGVASASGGASLEVGGAHWFAETQEQEEAVVDEAEVIDGTIALLVEYEFTAEGVSMQWQVDISRFMPAQSRGHINSLARIGTRLQLPAQLQRCAWLGRGPHENYIDRQDGALVRLYSADVSTLHTPYVAPSENGGRGGTRWVALMPPQQANSSQPETGCPVILAAAVPVSSSETCQSWPQDGGDVSSANVSQQDCSVFCPRDGLHFSASHHSTEDLFTAKYDHDMPRGGPCHLHLDGMHMGVGGDDSWTPSVHTPYLIRQGVYKFAVALNLLDGNASVEEVVKSALSMRARRMVKPA